MGNNKQNQQGSPLKRSIFFSTHSMRKSNVMRRTRFDWPCAPPPPLNTRFLLSQSQSLAPTNPKASRRGRPLFSSKVFGQFWHRPSSETVKLRYQGKYVLRLQDVGCLGRSTKPGQDDDAASNDDDEERKGHEGLPQGGYLLWEEVCYENDGEGQQQRQGR